MRRSHRLCPQLILSALILLPFASIGGPVLTSLLPDTASVGAGSTVNVEVRVKGSGAGMAPSVGAYDIILGYDSALFTAGTVDFSGALGNPDPFAFEMFHDVIALPGEINMAAVSLLGDIELDLLQSADILLATLSFEALVTGSGAFTLLSVRVDDAFGNKLSEPAPLKLFAAALLAWGLTYHRRRHSKQFLA